MDFSLPEIDLNRSTQNPNSCCNCGGDFGVTTCSNTAPSGFDGIAHEMLMVYTGLRPEYLPVTMSPVKWSWYPSERSTCGIHSETGHCWPCCWRCTPGSSEAQGTRDTTTYRRFKAARRDSGDRYARPSHAIRPIACGPRNRSRQRR